MTRPKRKPAPVRRIDGVKHVIAAAVAANEAVKAILPPPAPARPLRERLPDERKGVTRRFHVRAGGENVKVYVTVGRYPDGRIGEVFLKVDRQGTLASGALDAVALAISVGLQYGIPLGAFVDKFVGMRFEPAGFTGDNDDRYRTCTSVLDLVARYLRDLEEERVGGGGRR